MNTKTQVSVHETDPDLYAALAAACGEKHGENSHWVELQTATGFIHVCFFAPRASDKPEEVAA